MTPDFEEIYREHYTFIHHAATRFIGPNAAEDVVQETMLAAWLKFSSFNGESKLRTWLYRIMVNICLMKLRQKAPEFVDCATAKIPIGGCGDAVIARTTLPKILPKLQPRARAMLTMHYLDGMEVSEIAHAWGKTPGYIRGGMSRARVQARLEAA